MFSLICARINDWVNNRKAGDLRRRLAHYDVTEMRILVVIVHEMYFAYFIWTIAWAIDIE